MEIRYEATARKEAQDEPQLSEQDAEADPVPNPVPKEEPEEDLLVSVDEDKLQSAPLFYSEAKNKAEKETLIDFEKGVLSVTQKGAKVLTGLKAKKHCNLVFIFGNARYTQLRQSLHVVHLLMCVFF